MTDALDEPEKRRQGEPRLVAPRMVTGSRLTFRPATPDDAAFILSLRLDEEKNKHLSATSPDVERQREWLAALPSDQIYFIIEADARPVGTVRLYDQRGSSFCWGSWILSNDAPKSSAVESTLMVYATGLALGFTAAHFEVRKENVKVWQYHERCGAERIGEAEDEYLYTISEPAVQALFARYQSRLDGPVTVDW
jgi:RimJ/RimL family protein N-acetyltransferase